MNTRAADERVDGHGHLPVLDLLSAFRTSVSGFGFRVLDFGFQVPGLGFRVSREPWCSVKLISDNALNKWFL